MFSCLARLILVLVLVVAWQPAFASVRQPGTPTPQEVARTQEHRNGNDKADDFPEFRIQLRAILDWTVGAIIWLWNALNDNVGVVTLLFTGALVLFTRRLARVTGDVADAAKESADVAKSALTDLEQPVVFVRVTNSGLQIDLPSGRYTTSGAGAFSFEVVNYGRTPARLLEIATEWPVENRPGEEIHFIQLPDPIVRGHVPYRNLPDGCFSAIGAPYKENERLLPLLPMQDLREEGAWNKYCVCFMGYVCYSNTFNETFTHGFCFVFDTLGQRFVRWGGDKYNYTKKEKRNNSAPPEQTE